MTEERIGGIAVDIEGVDTKLEAALDRAEAKIKAWVQKVSASVDIGVNVSGGGPAPSRRAAAQPAPIRFGASASGGAKSSEQSAFDRAVQAELAKQGAMLVDGEVVAIQKAQKATAQRVRNAVRQELSSGPETASTEIPVTVDTSEFTKALADLVAEIKSLRTEAEKPITLRAAIADEGAPKGGGGGRGSRGVRRKNLRDQGIGTEAPSNRVYTYDPAVYDEQDRLAAARSTAERERIGTRLGSRPEPRATPAEQRLLNMLFPPTRGTVPPPLGGGTAARGSATFAPSFAETGRTYEQARAEEEARSRARRGNFNKEAAERQRAEEAERLKSIPRQAAYTTGAAAGRGPAGVGGRGTSVPQTDEAIERRAEQAAIRREAQSVSAGRTARTGASSLGSYAFGGGKQRIEAEAALTAATQKRTLAERNLIAAENRLNDPRQMTSVRARRHAIEEVTVAQTNLRKATEEEASALQKVQSFSGFAAGARNLLAVTTAGAVFGLGLKAVDVALAAGEKAAAPYFDAMTGWAQKTADLTSSLADQTRAQQGNAQAVVALRLAQAGFSADAAKSIQPLIQQRTQIEAGNKALVDQIETFRIAENLRKQNPNAGIGGGGTGGIAGTGLFGIPSAGEQVGNFLKSLNDISLPISGSASGAYRQGNGYRVPGVPAILPSSMVPGSENTEALTKAAVQRGLDFLNSQIQKGGGRAGAIQQGGTDAQVAQFKQAFAGVSPEMQAAADELRLFSTQITNTDSALRALNQINIAGTITGPAELLAGERARQQNAANSVEAIRARQQYEQTSFTESLKRQAAIAIGTTLPASAALANLAAPPTPVGTGIKGTNAAEAKKIRDYTAETQTLQDSLNAYYAKGRAIIENTYKPAILQTFGQAGVQAFSDILTQVTAVGKEMSTIQAGISNEQAAYQAKQYSYQLFIAKRTLSDIAGLTGKNFGVGKSELGVLEGQNLALSRQAQQLTFMLNQRQINLQKALAGFVVPGLTPAEQNARVQEAKIEADYAQKQLDIQKQMFGNQVKIVDISNLRQGADLVKQIALLQEGRKVTLDTQLAQEKLTRLSEMQQALSAEAGVYITTVNQQIAKAEANMTEIEAATGQRITRIMKQGITAAYAVGHAFFLGVSGGFLGDSGSSPTGKVGGQGGGSQAPKLNASGALFNTRGATSLGPYGIAGEANTETVAILRNPRRFMAEGMGGGGGSVNFYGDINVRSEADIEALVRKITAAQGRRAALSGLRGPN